MVRNSVVAITALVVVMLLSAVGGQRLAAGEPKKMSIEMLSWLTGSWAKYEEGKRSEEYWIAPAGGTMLGINRTIMGDRTVAYEFLRIAEQGDKLIYYAAPGGQSPDTPFTATIIGDQLVSFENPDHDFPKRISYRLVGKELRARIEGDVDGEYRAQEWTWQKQ